MQSPLRWNDDGKWKLDYNNIETMSPDELARRRAEFDKQKEIARGPARRESAGSAFSPCGRRWRDAARG